MGTQAGHLTAVHTMAKVAAKHDHTMAHRGVSALIDTGSLVPGASHGQDYSKTPALLPQQPAAHMPYGRSSQVKLLLNAAERLLQNQARKHTVFGSTEGSSSARSEEVT